MAHHDEDLVLGTGLDQTGFEKGSEKLIKAIQSTADSINAIGEKAAKSLSNIKIEPDMNSDEFDRAAARMDIKVQGVIKSLDRLSDASLQGLQSSKAVASFNRGIDEARMRIDEARIDLEEFGSYEFPTEQYARLNDQYEKASQRLVELQAQQDKLLAAGENKPSKKWVELNKDLTSTKSRIESLQITAQNTQDRIAEMKKELGGMQAGLSKESKKGDSADVQKMEALQLQIEKTKEKIDSQQDTWTKTVAAIKKAETEAIQYETKIKDLESKGVNLGTARWRSLLTDISLAEIQAEKYYNQIQQLDESGQGMIDPLQTDQYKQMESDLQAAEEALQRNQMIISQEAIEQARLNVLAAQEAYNRAETTREQVKALDNLKAAQAAYADTLASQMQPDELETGWTRFRDNMKDLGGTFVQFGSKVKDVGSKIAKIGSTAYKAFSKVGNGIKGAISKVKSFIGSANRSSLSVNNLVKKFTGLGSMLKSRIKRTFMTAVFKDLQASIQALAQYNSAFNLAMSNMKNRSSELSANVAVAFGGLVRQFEPIITRLLNTMSEAMVKINAVMAAIRGESTVEVAARQTQDYAASLSDQTKQSEKARAAQEKLNRTLTSYDEIHKLTDTSDSNSATEAADNAARFQTVAVSSILSSTDGLSALADRIKEAIASGDWRSLGAEAGNGLNSIIAAIDNKLEEAKGKATRLAHGIAEGLNGLTDAFDSYSFGKTIAHAINLGLDFAYEFLTDYDFSRLGQKTADGLNGLLDNFDGRKLGGTIAAGINGAIDWAFETVTNLDWDKLGSKIGDIFNALFGGGNKITERTTKNVGGAARNAYMSSMESSVSGIDWKKLAQTFSAAISGALNSIASAFETTDWERVGEALVEFFTGIDWDGVAQAVYRLLGAALGGLSGLLVGALKAAKEEGVNWADKLYGDYFKQHPEELEAIGDNIGEGVWLGFKLAFQNCAQKIKDNVLKPLISGFEKAFGIASPAKEMKPEGKYVGEGVLAGIKEVFSDVANWISENIVEPFKKGLSEKFQIVGGAAKALNSSGESIAAGIKSGIESKWDTVTTFLGGKADDLNGVFTSTTRRGKYVEAGSTISAAIKEGVENSWSLDSSSKFTESGKSIAEGLRSGIVGKFGEGGFWQSAWNQLDNLRDWISDSGYSNFWDAGSRIADGIKDGVRQGLENFDPSDYTESWGSVSNLVAQLRGRPGQISSIASAAVSEVEETADGASTVLSKLTDAMSLIVTQLMKISNAMPQISAVGTPAIASGAFAPAGTAVSASDGKEIKQLLNQIIGMMKAREEAPLPSIQLESTINLDSREIGRATAEYNTSNSRIDNGNWNGGLR